MGRVRSLAAWLPAAVLVPATLAAAVSVTRTDESAPAMDQVLPLDAGTTWIYRTSGDATGYHVRQVVGQAQLITDDGLTEMTRVMNRYDDFQGSPQTYGVYVSVADDTVLQHGLIVRGEKLDVIPPAPGFTLPAEVGRSWKYSGERGGNPLDYGIEVTETGDVEVAGHTFEDCAEYTTTIDIRDDDDPSHVEVIEEWTCPGIGVVRSTDVDESQDFEVVEELVSFQGPHRSLVLGDLPDTSATSDVSTAGFDTGRTHAVPDGRLGRDLAWTETRDAYSGMPAVSDGTTAVVGEKDGLVSARDVASGRLLWQVTLSPPIVAAPAIADGLVLVADSGKRLWALSLTDGSARWVRRFDDVLSATPVVADGVVAVALEDGTVRGLSPDDGGEDWSLALDGLVRTDPAADGEVLVVGNLDGGLVGVDLDDGEEQWKVQLGKGLDLGPVISDGVVLAVDGDGVLVAYDLEDGDAVWQAPGSGFLTQAPAAGSGTVVAAMSTGELEGRDLDTGELLWSREVGALGAAPAVVGDEVMAVGERGRVTVLGLDDGRVRDSWDLPLPTPDADLEVDSPLALVGDDIVISAEVGAPDVGFTSYAYPARDEQDRPVGVAYTVSTFGFPVPLGTPAVLDGDTAYALGFDQTLYRSDGAAAAPILTGTGATVGLAAQDGVVVVPKDDQVWGVSGETGERLWKLPATAAFPGTFPAVADGTAFVPIREVGLVATDLETGEGRWVVSVDGTAGTSVPLPLDGGDVLYAGSGLTRYDGATGDVVWALGGDLADSVAYAPIAADDSAAYAQLTSFDATSPTFEKNEIVAADLGTGEVRWRHLLGSGSFLLGTAAGDGVVVSIDGGGLVAGLDAGTGEVRWTYQLSSAAAGAPVVVDGVVHLAERGRPEDLLQRDFRIVTVDAETGRFLGSFEPPSANDVPLATVGSGPDGELLVPTTSDIGQNVAVLEVVRD